MLPATGEGREPSSPEAREMLGTRAKEARSMSPSSYPGATMGGGSAQRLDLESAAYPSNGNPDGLFLIPSVAVAGVSSMKCQENLKGKSSAEPNVTRTEDVGTDAEPEQSGAAESLLGGETSTRGGLAGRVAEGSAGDGSHVAGSGKAKMPMKQLGVFVLLVSLGIVMLLAALGLPLLRPQAPPTCSLDNSLSSSAASGAWGRARALSRLDRPMVILVSSDGFRADYLLRLPPDSNLARFRSEATVAWAGMLPPFPSVTFPSHYSMATGLLPAWHGIVSNRFVDPTNTSLHFSMDNTDARWWLGEPMWETATKQGLIAATMFWPGANVEKGPWDCPAGRCFKDYDGSVTYDQRVDTVLDWVSRPASSRPSFITLYFDEPDHSGHEGGPDTPLIPAALARVDVAMGRLTAGLQSMAVLDDVNIILVSDHGMLSTCGERTLYLEDFAKHVPGFNKSWLTMNWLFVGILPPPNADVGETLKLLQQALPSVHNGDRLQLWLREDFPERFHISSSARVPPILGLVEEGYQTLYDETDWASGKCLGTHGFDNKLASMRAIFMARGPRFAQGRPVGSFMNVEVYNIVASILNIDPAPNNGTSDFPSQILLPH